MITSFEFIRYFPVRGKDGVICICAKEHDLALGGNIVSVVALWSVTFLIIPALEYSVA